MNVGNPIILMRVAGEVLVILVLIVISHQLQLLRGYNSAAHIHVLHYRIVIRVLHIAELG